ncbi:MAG: TetR/AcrR family transcriptional regulator [Treponema sp.]|nr:TetR/AcrR family transcriptional regulator [Treponema sp.]
MDIYMDNLPFFIGQAGPIPYICSKHYGTSMARPVSFTKERIIQAAIELIRHNGPESVSARNLTAALGSGTSPIFSSFGSMEGLMSAVLTEVRRQFHHRLETGFSLNPPFKGFGLAFVWFAMDEPQLYKLIMSNPRQATSFEDYIDEHVGFKEECLAAIGKSIGLQGHDAEMIYYQLFLVAMGLAQSCVEGGAQLNLGQVSEIFGKNVRAFLMVIRAGADPVESFMPSEGPGPDIDVDTYLMMRPLTGQNHLLQELFAAPRYIKEAEWEELERVLRNTAGITPVSLRKAHPGLTRGDIRIILLDRLGFSVTQQAALLGISAPSVTKARQRMKMKALIYNKPV